MSLLAPTSRLAIATALAVAAIHPASAQERPPASPGQPTEEQQVPDEVIVTGTRASGITAAESATPIKVLGAETLSHVGQPNLNQVLTQLVPSFTAQAFGGDTANLTLSARLRGLSPNHTLVLINGKRRHGTANLAVLGGPYQGAATADLDLISPSSIQRIEVLEDGAAAQYGSDAIAGVINIILKNDSSGGDGYVTGGQNYQTGGATGAATLHLATKLGDNGFINLTGFYRFHDFTQVGGLDRRVTDPNGNLFTSYAGNRYSGPVNPALDTALRAAYGTISRFPYVNRINGDAKSNLTNLQYNSGYDFGGVEVYSFGSYSRRIASAYENLRVPDRVIASPVLGVGGNFITPGELIFSPHGFDPREGIREDDYAATGGVRGMVSGFHYDLSATYGQDKNSVYTLDSANASLFVDTHFTPVDFYDGSFKAGEFTGNADFTREFELGMAKPLTLAFGGEYRRNTYTIGYGDPGSIYKEGGQSYPGFRPSDAGTHHRSDVAGYADVSLNPMDSLKVDVAGRYEHYSDFGGEVSGKLTARYDFSPAFALRGTVSNGFRAPTLAESYYSATNVSPTSAFVQLPANSAAAKLLGFSNLKPEKSVNFSAGAVWRPAPRLTVTVDAYQVRINNRILGTGTLFSSGGGNIVINGTSYSVNFPAVQTAVVANGNILDPTVTQTGVNIFTNGANTRTRGIDLVATYRSDFGDAGAVTWTLSGNYNQTKLTKLYAAPAQLTPQTSTGMLAPTPIALFDQGAQSNLLTASPRVKVIGSAFYSLDKFSATLRGTVFGTTAAYATPDGANFYKQSIGTSFIGDIEVNYKVTKTLQFSLGANNVFNKRPPSVQCVVNATTAAACASIGTTRPTLVNGGNVYDGPLTFSPYGINGGYYYGRINVSF